MESIKSLISKPDVSIKNAWKQLSDNGYRALFIVDDNGCLMGSLVDGDVRRWVLQDRPINESVDRLMNRHPICITEKDAGNKELIKSKFVQYRVECIPIVDDRKQIKRVVFWDELFKGNGSAVVEKIDVPVIIMAGGRGERLSPFTKILPKPLIPIGEKPVIELIMERFALYGVKDFYLSVNYKANMIRAYFSDLDHSHNIAFLQEDQPRGTAGSLAALNGQLKSTFIVSNADILVEANYSDLLQFHRKNGNVITLVCSMKHFPIPYGVVQIGDGGMLKEIQEKPEFDCLVLTGIYVMEPELLSWIPNDQVFHMTNLIDKLRVENRKVGVYPIAEKMWVDIGEMKEYRETLKRFE